MNKYQEHILSVGVNCLNKCSVCEYFTTAHGSKKRSEQNG